MAADRPGHPLTLAALQERFAVALAQADRRAPALETIRGDADRAGRRFDLYRANLRGVWEKALAAAYPVIRRYVGEDFFYAMSGVYGSRFPSRSGDLNRFGIDLPAFLEQFHGAAAYPWLPDLARLEWAVHLSHYAADAEPLAAAAVAALSAAELDRLTVSLHPACALVSFRWDVAALWQWHQEPEPGPWTEDIERPVAALVWRPRWQVQVRPLGAAESAGLAGVLAGQSLGEALDAALGADAGADIAALFARWLTDGVLTERRRG